MTKCSVAPSLEPELLPTLRGTIRGTRAVVMVKLLEMVDSMKTENVADEFRIPFKARGFMQAMSKDFIHT